MLQRIHFFAVPAALLIAACGTTAPVRPDAVVVTGLGEPRTFAAAELAVVGAEEVRFDHRNEPHVYRAIRLDTLLAHCGLAPGRSGKDVPAADKHHELRRTVRVVARDGFEAVFAWAELDPRLGPTRAFVAFERDGRAMESSEGPIRLVVPTDARTSRCVRQVARVEVR